MVHRGMTEAPHADGLEARAVLHTLARAQGLLTRPFARRCDLSGWTAWLEPMPVATSPGTLVLKTPAEPHATRAVQSSSRGACARQDLRLP